MMVISQRACFVSLCAITRHSFKRCYIAGRGASRRWLYRLHCHHWGRCHGNRCKR